MLCFQTIRGQFIIVFKLKYYTKHHLIIFLKFYKWYFDFFLLLKQFRSLKLLNICTSQHF